MPRVKNAKKIHKHYNDGHDKLSQRGAGPLRVRGVLLPSHGKCMSCKMDDDLNGGFCKFCLGMMNDTDVDPKKRNRTKRGRAPLTFYEGV